MYSEKEGEEEGAKDSLIIIHFLVIKLTKGCLVSWSDVVAAWRAFGH